jgi:hypothetical protein
MSTHLTTLYTRSLSTFLYFLSVVVDQNAPLSSLSCVWLVGCTVQLVISVAPTTAIVHTAQYTAIVHMQKPLQRRQAIARINDCFAIAAAA